MRIILATNNKNKVREVGEILSPMGYEVVSQSDAGIDIDVEENGTTFEENAFLKADAVHKLSGDICIADDSGLEVDYLNGEPGVYSARYAEPGHRCQKVLDKLEGVPDEKRTARFVCCICFIGRDGTSKTFRGTCEGRIGHEKRGTNGFGYDPIFMVGDKSFAEISAEEKNGMSHRGAALRMLAEYLAERKDK